jgi:ribosomal protein S12 methylthiotransferase
MKEADACRSPGSYFFVNLGCPKNLVDAERVAAGLQAYGWGEVSSIGEADLIVVTTCAFISSAEEESIETILGIAAAKRPSQLLAVLGCLVSREGAELEPLLPEVDLFLAVDEMADLPARVTADGPARAVSVGGGATGRILFTPPHIAYLKIAEGCSNRCAYCMIPAIRGGLRSRRARDIQAEAADLTSAGVKELVIVAQDTSAWNSEMGRVVEEGPRSDVYRLLEDIAGVAPAWIRLMYLHPARVDPRRIIGLAEREAILPYLDIPVQHASDRVLERMGRGYGLDDLRRIFGALRSSRIEFALRTTVMVGFPGETDSDFRMLHDFLDEFSLDHVGVFEFSPERGTRAALLEERVPERTKVDRRDAILELQMDISHERLGARIGGRETILVDGLLEEDERPSPDVWGIGRFYGQSYEIDGVTFLSGTELAPGRFASGRILEAEAYDLFASIDRDLG